MEKKEIDLRNPSREINKVVIEEIRSENITKGKIETYYKRDALCIRIYYPIIKKAIPSLDNFKESLENEISSLENRKSEFLDAHKLRMDGLQRSLNKISYIDKAIDSKITDHSSDNQREFDQMLNDLDDLIEKWKVS